jgi:hypothetical protein
MKFVMIMKDPDGVSDAFKNAVMKSISDEEQDDLWDKIEEEQSKVEKYLRYGEYVKIEVDTDKGTMKVIPWK